MTKGASRLVLVLIGTCIVLLLAACDTNTDTRAPASGEVVKTEASNQYRDVTADELKGMMEEKDLFLVDVHVPHEGRLPRLDARIPYNEIADNLDKLPTDKAATIVLTCKSGSMSAAASRTLADLGYSNVYNLKGGFVAWKNKGYEFTPEP